MDQLEWLAWSNFLIYWDTNLSGLAKLLLWLRNDFWKNTASKKIWITNQYLSPTLKIGSRQWHERRERGVWCCSDLGIDPWADTLSCLCHPRSLVTPVRVCHNLDLVMPTIVIASLPMISLLGSVLNLHWLLLTSLIALILHAYVMQWWELGWAD